MHHNSPHTTHHATPVHHNSPQPTHHSPTPVHHHHHIAPTPFPPMPMGPVTTQQPLYPNPNPPFYGYGQQQPPYNPQYAPYPAQTPGYPQYPPVAQPHPMVDSEFHNLKQRIKNAPFSSDKAGVVDLAASTHYFSCHQVADIIRDTLPFSADQLHALEAFNHKIVDRGNVFTILDAFKFANDREKAKRILQC